MANPLVNAVAAYARNAFIRMTPADNASIKGPILAKIMKNKKPTGGEYLTWNIRYQNNDSTMDGGPLQKADVVQRRVVTQARAKNVVLWEPIVLSKIELRQAKNSGPSGGVTMGNMIEDKIEAAIASMGEHLSRSIWSAGTPGTNARGQTLTPFTGLGAIGSRTLDYGDIAVAAAPNWKGGYMDVSSATGGTHLGLTFTGTAPTISNLETSTHVYYLPRLISKMITHISFGNDKPDCIGMGEGMYDIAENIYRREAQQLTGPSADLGFTGFKVRGVEVLLDKTAPAGQIGFFNTKYFGVGAGAGADMKLGKIEDLGPLEDGIGGLLEMEGNFWCSHRRAQGLAVGFSETIS